MNILHTLPKFKNKTVVALGNFDGVHLGHQRLMKECVQAAEEMQLSSVVLTLDPHPDKVLFPSRDFKLLLSNRKKSELIQGLGIENLVFLPFNLRIAKYRPEEFVQKILCEGLNVHTVFIGFNYTFGIYASGNVDTMQELSRKYGFSVREISPVSIDGDVVSSTKVRCYLEQGQVEKARALLGYWPVLNGVVTVGQQNGRLIGYPTANLDIGEDVLVPQNGVYASMIKIHDQHYMGMTNIGHRPTVGKNLPKTIEVHIFNFNQVIYGCELEVSLFKKMRDEKSFNSWHELKQQLNSDYACTEKYFSSLGSITRNIFSNS